MNNFSMIVFVTTAAHAYTLSSLLEGERTLLSGRLIMLSYGEFTSWTRLPVGTYVLADIDRLTDADRGQVDARLDALCRALPDCRVLNHPLASLRRPELLAALHASGINAFRAFPLDADPSSMRYPVFVRSTIEHDGPLTPLMADSEALLNAVAGLRQSRDHTAGDWLIVEFIDVRNAEGLFEKYSAYRIGDRIIAADRSVNDAWVCKGEHGELAAEDWADRDREFQHDNPHAELLRPVFEMARIEYGRIDYAFHAGRMQVFEINCNPMIASPSQVGLVWREAMQRKTTQYVEALLALDDRGSGRYFVEVDGARGADRIDGGSAARRALRRLLRSAKLLHREQDYARRLKQLKPARLGPRHQ